MGLFDPIDTGLDGGDIALMQDMHEVFAYNEVVRILWGGEWFYYANIAYDVAPFNNIFDIIGAVPIHVRLQENWFAEFKITSIIEDNDVSWEFWDSDSHFRDKHRLYGSGSRIELYGYWPEMTVGNPNGMLRCLWWGILGQPDKSDTQLFKVKATAGTRSPKLDLPRRIIYPGCSRLFGGQTNPVDNQPFLTTQAMIDEHACPYNRHLVPDGGFGLLNGGVPFTSCPRDSLAACNDRLGPDEGWKYYAGFDHIKASGIVQIKGHSHSAVTNANASIIRSVIGVTYGVAMVGELQPLLYQDQSFGNQVPKGYVTIVWPLSEGPIAGNYPEWGIYYIHVDGKWVPTYNSVGQHGGYGASYRIPGVTTLGYSKTAWFWTNIVISDFPGTDFQAIRAGCLANGLNEIRVYYGTGPTDYNAVWTDSRVWCFRDMLMSKIYGMGYGHSGYPVQDWINLGSWGDQLVDAVWFPDETGTPVVTGRKRSTLNVHVKGRPAQQVIKEICSAGHFGTPFFWNGAVRVVGLGLENVIAAQQFTEEVETYGFRNIQPGSLTYTQKSDSELVNLLEVKFVERRFPAPTGAALTDNDPIHGVPPLFVEQTLVFDDQIQQLKAGLALGEPTLQVVKGNFEAFGVDNYHEAVRLGAMVFDVGEQERGGLANNLTAYFTTWFPSSDGIQLHPYKVIQIMSVELQKYEEIPGEPFQYFRVLPTLVRKGDLTLQVEAQAYPLQYYSAIEDGNPIRPLPVITRGVSAPRGPVKIPRPEGTFRRRDTAQIQVKRSD